MNTTKTPVIIDLETIERWKQNAYSIWETMVDEYTDIMGNRAERHVGKTEGTAEVDLDRIRSLVAEIRDAYGCGTIAESLIIDTGSNETDLDSIGGLVDDVTNALNRLESGRVEDFGENMGTVRSEVEYLEQVRWDEYSAIVSSDVDARIGRIGNALEELLTLGF